MNNSIERKKSLEYWNGLYKNYNKGEIKIDDWLEKFDNIINNCSTFVIDLGCGLGNNTSYLLEKGKNVISCDQSCIAIESIKNFPKVKKALCFNMLDGLPFENNYCELIIADLCLHYFREKDTFKIINEIKRVLKSNGYFIFRVNSINDVNHGAGKGLEIEKHLYINDDSYLKRFFDEEDIKYFFKDFEIIYLHEEMMTRYQLEKKLYTVCVKNR